MPFVSIFQVHKFYAINHCYRYLLVPVRLWDLPQRDCFQCYILRGVMLRSHAHEAKSHIISALT